MINLFRKLGLIEGISLILLLFIAMPAKYYFGYYDAVKYVGMTHGLLWLFYVIFSLIVSHKNEWNIGFWLLVILSSITPFGWIIIDKRLKP